MRTKILKALLATRADQRVRERFWQRVEKMGGEDGCWEWRGAVKAGSYPSIQIGAHSVAPSYLSWYWRTGELPLGGQLQQICKNHLCVRPSHLTWIVSRVTAQRLAASTDGYLQFSGELSAPDRESRVGLVLRLSTEAAGYATVMPADCRLRGRQSFRIQKCQRK